MVIEGRHEAYVTHNTHKEAVEGYDLLQGCPIALSSIAQYDLKTDKGSPLLPNPLYRK
jgi:hypothetical protein